jgi:hypothetical protein
MSRGPRLPKAPIRDVPVLHPMNWDPATPEQIQFFSQVIEAHGGYMVAIDRQSDDKELKRSGHTGQIRRVDGIMSQVRPGYWLPAPIYHPDRQDGELPYSFHRAFWFVDGEKKRATGHTADPNARPEFRRGYLQALALAEAGCGPKMVVFGEATRFFRDEQWLMSFCHSCWDAKIELFVVGYGPVTRPTLPGLIALINALSAWLPECAKGARKARREQGRIWTKQRPPFGLLFDPEDDRKVYAHPTEWPILRRMMFLLADGTLRTQYEACAWLKAQG